MITPLSILQKHWGYNFFRPLQQDIIMSVVNGHDTLALMPTGGGKSICFQVPAMMHEGLCLVISPLIALMKDQVSALRQKGIPGLCIYSGMNRTEVIKTLENAVHGNFKFLYVSPERLETTLFLEYLPAIEINLIAVDEAHCISQWGYDFRPPYLRIAQLRELIPKAPVLALTASATLEVQNDICDKLLFKKNHQRFQQSFERNNLSYSVFNPPSKQNKLIDILKKVAGSGIVYCKTRRRTKEVEELLNANGINASHYHAGLSTELRNTRQDEWLTGKTRIMACTNAFGMGIDKPDVRVVVHYDVPDALENYYQEAGRAGRDGKKAYSVLLYNEQELLDLKSQTILKYPETAIIKQVYAALVNYFQLAAGNGEDVSFDFEISDFTKKFKLHSVLVNNVLKILEQEEISSYSEQFFMPSTVVFTTDKNELDIFERNYPQYEPVIKGLLRSYNGIFDYPALINEFNLARFIAMPKEKVIAELYDLQKIGIIDYTPQKEKPQITFLRNRVATADLAINQKNLQKRKNAYEQRLNAMISYIKEPRCRSITIANYFNDFSVNQCGICDNCLTEKNISVSKEEFEKIMTGIKNSLLNAPLSFHELKIKLQPFKQSHIKKVLHFLQQEHIVKITQDGLIDLKREVST